MSLRRRESCRRAARRTTALITITRCCARCARSVRRLPSTCELQKVRRRRLADGRTRNIRGGICRKQRCATGRTTHRATTTRRSIRTAGCELGVVRAVSLGAGDGDVGSRAARGAAGHEDEAIIARTAGSSRTLAGAAASREVAARRGGRGRRLLRHAQPRAGRGHRRRLRFDGEDLGTGAVPKAPRGARGDRAPVDGRCRARTRAAADPAQIVRPYSSLCRKS